MKLTTSDDKGFSSTKESSSYIKIEKNSKGYNWTISLDFDRYSEDDENEVFTKLKEHDKKLQKLFGGAPQEEA
jgi:hypothetical protein